MHKIWEKDEMLLKLLNNCLNVIIKTGLSPERWKLAISLMLEKGSGPRIDKLRIVNLIEADLQITMKHICKCEETC